MSLRFLNVAIFLQNLHYGALQHVQETLLRHASMKRYYVCHPLEGSHLTFEEDNSKSQ